MDEFPGYYNNINKILRYMEDNNGKHGINYKKAEEWVKAQPIKEARNIAKKVVDSVEYVTFEQVQNYLEKLITTRYREIQEDKNNIIHMFIGESNKSNYFLSMLGLYYIKKHKYREPSKYFTSIPYDVMDVVNNVNKKPVLIYIDDKTYSGGQLIHIITNLIFTIYNNNLNNLINNKFGSDIVELYNKKDYNKLLEIIGNSKDDNAKNFKKEFYEVMKNINYFDIEFILLGVNKISLDRLINNSNEHIYKSYRYYLEIKEAKELPFKIKYNFHYSKNYKTINDIFTEKEQFYLGYYFSFGRLPNVLVYFDYKIADDTSTILKILNYGPVVPENYDIINYWPNFRNVLNKSSNKFIQENYYISSNTKYFYELAHKYYKVVNMGYQNINKPIRFIPFINNCKNVHNIINNRLMKYINYAMFLTISNIGTISFYRTREKMNNIPMFTQLDLINKYIKDNTLRESLIKFLGDIDQQRCELTFYKAIKWSKRKSSKIRGLVSKLRSTKTKKKV